MPTPIAYAGLAKFINETISKAKWKFIAAVTFISITPVIVEKTVPETGDIPGKIIFVFLVFYFSLLLPFFLYRKHSQQCTSTNQKAVAWGKAALCNIWVIFCIWFIYAGLFNKH